jgi:hypothetical protein
MERRRQLAGYVMIASLGNCRSGPYRRSKAGVGALDQSFKQGVLKALLSGLVALAMHNPAMAQDSSDAAIPFSKLAVTPKALHFKKLDLATNQGPEILSFKVSNTGTEALDITVNPPSGGPFSITSGVGDTTIPSKSSASVSVEFAPIAAQKKAYTATISVTSDATKGKNATGVRLSAIAVRSGVAGTILVCNGAGLPSIDSVTEYPLGSDGNVSPIVVISGNNPGFDELGGIAVDSSGEVYVSNYSSGIKVFSSGSNGDVTPVAEIIGAGGDGVAVDSIGNIYAANGVDVTEYPPGSNGVVTPIARISGGLTGLNGPFGVAVDSKANIYVANASGGDTNRGSVTIYPPGTNGNVFFLAEIAGDLTELNQPLSIALDSKGRVYVANYYGGPTGVGSVTVYRSLGKSTGLVNEVPLVTIAGPKTGLSEPRGIAVDSKGNILVANIDGGPDGLNGHGSITVYRAGSKGNVAPMATISAPLGGTDQTMLLAPDGIAIGPPIP